MPVATPIPVTEGDLAGVTFNADGLVPAIVQEQGTGAVLMLAWMDETAFRRTLATGRTWFWSVAPGVLVQGGDVGGPPVGA